MLGDKIKKIRLEKNMGLNETARIAGITGGYLSSIENGKRTNPSTESLQRIATALGVSVNDFFDSPNIDKNDKEKEYEDLISKEFFDTPEEAMKFILMQPSIMGFGGFDVTKMSDEEILDFANELLNQLKLISYKYKK